MYKDWHNDICAFLRKADHEGGLGPFIIDYGVDPEDLGPELQGLAGSIIKLKEAMEQMQSIIELIQEGKECE